MLTFEKITKKYKDTIALDEVSFTLNESEILGVLGPNGSGKTTLVKLICGLISPDKGNITFSSSLKQRINSNPGVVFEEHGFFKELSVEKNLKFYCILKNISVDIIPEISAVCGLNPYMKKKAKQLSLGMMQRLAWARSLLADPAFFVYDDPTIGLDPRGIADLRKLILKLKDDNKSLLITSHNLAEMEKICSMVLFLNKGKVICYENSSSLINQYGNLENAYLTLIQ